MLAKKDCVVNVDDGKYTWYVEDHCPKCDRYGEVWRSHCGDGAIYALIYHAAMLEELLFLAEGQGTLPPSLRKEIRHFLRLNLECRVP